MNSQITGYLTAYLPWLLTLAPLAMFWNQTKAIITKFFRLFVIKINLENEASIAFTRYVLNNCKRYQLGDWNYQGRKIFSKFERKRIRIGYEKLNLTPQIIKINKTFVLVKDDTGQKDQNSRWKEDCVNIYYIRGTFDHEKFLIKCLDDINNDMSSNRFRIEIKYGMGKRQFVSSRIDNNQNTPDYVGKQDFENDLLNNNNHRILKYNIKDLGGNEEKSSILKGYVFCDTANNLLDECKKWMQAEEWYKEHGLNWRRGFLLHGLQGTGKTSLVRKICQILDIPLFVFDLASMSNSEFIENWKEIQSFTPCAIIFDDIDKVFDKKENMAGNEGGGLTFDCFLSGLSGALPVQGILTFATANDISKIDETLGATKNGLMTRPGRIDSIIEIGLMERKNRIELTKLILGRDDEQLVESGDGQTAAQFADTLTQKVLSEFWNIKDKMGQTVP